MKRLVAALAVLLACTAAPAGAATTWDVGLADTMFRNGMCPSPAGNNIATIGVGDTVRWTNCDAFDHDIEWIQPGFPDPKVMQPADVVTQRFSKAGFYDYYCAIHPTMQGRVNVTGQPTATTRPPVAPGPTTTAPTTVTTTTTTGPPVTIAPGVSTTSSTVVETTTTTIDERPIASKDKGASAPIVALLVVAIAAVAGAGVYALRRMRQP